MLNIKPNGVYVDCTAGHGGHSLAISQKLNSLGTLILIDQDANSLAIAKKRLQSFKGRIVFCVANFIALKQLLTNQNIQKVDGFLYDLGFSAAQIYKSDRGFSYQLNGPLDMRMNRQQTFSAFEIVNHYSYLQLSKILKMYGEEPHANLIAKAICQNRLQAPITTTNQLVAIIKSALPQNRRNKSRIHPARLTFQALRIAVNNEINALSASLQQTKAFRTTNTRVVVISYHSLEDRIVKQFFNAQTDQNLITKKPILADQIEIDRNLQARSAKMRVLEYVQ